MAQQPIEQIGDTFLATPPGSRLSQAQRVDGRQRYTAGSEPMFEGPLRGAAITTSGQADATARAKGIGLAAGPEQPAGTAQPQHGEGGTE